MHAVTFDPRAGYSDPTLRSSGTGPLPQGITGWSPMSVIPPGYPTQYQQPYSLAPRHLPPGGGFQPSSPNRLFGTYSNPMQPRTFCDSSLAPSPGFVESRGSTPSTRSLFPATPDIDLRQEAGPASGRSLLGGTNVSYSGYSGLIEHPQALQSFPASVNVNYQYNIPGGSIQPWQCRPGNLGAPNTHPVSPGNWHELGHSDESVENPFKELGPNEDWDVDRLGVSLRADRIPLTRKPHIPDSIVGSSPPSTQTLSPACPPLQVAEAPQSHTPDWSENPSETRTSARIAAKRQKPSSGANQDELSQPDEDEADADHSSDKDWNEQEAPGKRYRGKNSKRKGRPSKSPPRRRTSHPRPKQGDQTLIGASTMRQGGTYVYQDSCRQQPIPNLPHVNKPGDTSLHGQLSLSGLLGVYPELPYKLPLFYYSLLPDLSMNPDAVPMIGTIQQTLPPTEKAEVLRQYFHKGKRVVAQIDGFTTRCGARYQGPDGQWPTLTGALRIAIRNVRRKVVERCENYKYTRRDILNKIYGKDRWEPIEYGMVRWVDGVSPPDPAGDLAAVTFVVQPRSLPRHALSLETNGHLEFVSASPQLNPHLETGTQPYSSHHQRHRTRSLPTHTQPEGNGIEVSASGVVNQGPVPSMVMDPTNNGYVSLSAHHLVSPIDSTTMVSEPMASLPNGSLTPPMDQSDPSVMSSQFSYLRAPYQAQNRYRPNLTVKTAGPYTQDPYTIPQPFPARQPSDIELGPGPLPCPQFYSNSLATTPSLSPCTLQTSSASSVSLPPSVELDPPVVSTPYQNYKSVGGPATLHSSPSANSTTYPLPQVSPNLPKVSAPQAGPFSAHSVHTPSLSMISASSGEGSQLTIQRSSLSPYPSAL